MNSQSTSNAPDHPNAPDRPVSTPGPASDDAPSDRETARRSTGVKEKIKRSAKGEGEPVEKKHPDVPFLVVGLTYLAVLGVIFLIVALILFLW